MLPLFCRVGRSRFGVVALVLLLTACATSSPPPEPPPPQPAPVRPVRLGLALGGGAARGFAHIGVLLALENAGIRPDLIAGTSAGSVVGALYAAGLRGSALQQTALAMDESTIADWTLPVFNRGVLRGEALARYVAGLVQSRSLEQLPLPLGVVATDLQSGQGVLFQRGDVATAVRASSAVPGVFLPVTIQGRDYVDGGLVAPVPVRYARQMGADVVLAVDISSPPQVGAGSDLLGILLQTFSIMVQSINALELRQAEVQVRPSLTGVASTDFTVRARAIEAGRAAMQAALPQLRTALAEAARRP